MTDKLDHLTPITNVHEVLPNGNGEDSLTREDAEFLLHLLANVQIAGVLVMRAYAIIQKLTVTAQWAPGEWERRYLRPTPVT